MNAREEKGLEAEGKFREWLDHHEIPFWFIEQQSIKHSRALLQKYGSKRPDFTILIPNFGTFLVDVKHKDKLTKYDKFSVKKKEVESYLNLQKFFNLRVWYAISNDSVAYKTWYWMPVWKIQECGDEYSTNKELIFIEVAKFIQTSFDDTPLKLLSHEFK